MPGPCNGKKRKEKQAKKRQLKLKRDALKDLPVQSVTNEADEDVCGGSAEEEAQGIGGTASLLPDADGPESRMRDSTPPVVNQYVDHTPSALQNPFIVNPGNGPRVKNASAYLSSFFAPPISYDDPMCAYFAGSNVLGSLQSVLPEEVALVSDSWSTRSCSNSLVDCMVFNLDLMVQQDSQYRSDLPCMSAPVSTRGHLT